jgi:small subunit ribosomal protein S7
MPRSTILQKTKSIKDIEYNSFILYLLIQQLLKKGKQLLAKRIVYKTCLYIEEQTRKDALKILEEAIINARPILKLKKTTKKQIQRIPVELNAFRGILLAIRAIIHAIDSQKHLNFSIKLANSILSTAHGIGNAIKQREESLAIAKATKLLTFYEL